jgi:hypothetical protein
MPRPTIIIAEPEPLQALSVRKLILETAKYNVLTAHSTREAVELLQLFPKVDAAVLVGDQVVDVDFLAKAIKGFSKAIHVIALTPRMGHRYEAADHTLSSYEPENLLDLMRLLVGDPRPMHQQPKENVEMRQRGDS